MELLAFINNSTLMVHFLKANFCDTEQLNYLCDGLLVWQSISPFLVIVDIVNVESYKTKLATFTDHLKTFYNIVDIIKQKTFYK